MQITLTASGVLSVAIDAHNGQGFMNDIAPTNIVGLNGQPAVPANVHLGFSSSTGGATSRHQIGGLTVTTIGSGGGGGGGGGNQDNVTYHNNNLLTGWYQNETALNATNVASSSFHLISTLTTAGKSYSQPLYLSNQKVANGTTHNLLVVTDSTDVVYAYMPTRSGSCGRATSRTSAPASGNNSPPIPAATTRGPMSELTARP